MEDVLSGNAVLGFLVAVVGAALTAISGTRRWQEWRESVAAGERGAVLRAVAAAVEDVYQRFVRPAKLGSATGALCDVERQEAMDRALAGVRAQLNGRGQVSAADGYSVEDLKALVEARIRQVKGEASVKAAGLVDRLADGLVGAVDRGISRVGAKIGGGG